MRLGLTTEPLSRSSAGVAGASLAEGRWAHFLPRLPVTLTGTDRTKFSVRAEFAAGPPPPTRVAVSPQPPGYKPPQHVPGLTLALLDAEAGLADHRLDVAVRAAAAGQPVPRRLEPVLSASPRGAAGPHMLQHAKLAIRREHAADLGEAFPRLVHAAEDPAADDRVEAPVGKRQRLDPVTELDKIVEHSTRYHRMVTAFETALDGRADAAAEDIDTMPMEDPTVDADMLMWRAIILALAGRERDAATLFATLRRHNAGFVDITRQLRGAGVVPAFALLDRILDEA